MAAEASMEVVRNFLRVVMLGNLARIGEGAFPFYRNPVSPPAGRAYWVALSR